MGSANDDLTASAAIPIAISLVGLLAGVYQLLVKDENAADAVEHGVRVAGCILLVVPAVWLWRRRQREGSVAWWMWTLSALALLAFAVMPVSFATHGEKGWPERLDDGASMLGAVALLTAIAAWVLYSRDRQVRAHRRCPFCAETIRREALICRHCGSRSSAQPSPERPPSPAADVSGTAP